MPANANTFLEAVENMQPRDNTPHSLRARRTQPALPGANVRTSPLAVPAPRNTASPQRANRKRPNPTRRAILKLLGLGALFELLLLALYPLLANATTKNEAAKQALLGIWPWLPHLYWTTAFPRLVQGLSIIPFFHVNGPAAVMGNANLLLVLLGLAFVLLLFATRIGNRVLKERLNPRNIRLLFWTIIGLTALFGITALFAPTGFWPDMFLYGLFGRMVTIYHVNPYVPSPSTISSDLLYAVLPKGTAETAPYGPIWLDISIPVVLLARESVANVLIGFRIVGLIVHLANAVLIWVLLAKFKPETRISGTVLYAWNPVVLLLGVTEMHYDGVVVLAVLLAALFFQRNSPIIGWIFMLVATLLNMLCLLLLPLFLSLLRRESQTMRRGRRFLWWWLILGISIGIVMLAYAPYWPGWGITGILTSIRQTFWPDTAINSLDATLLQLPILSSMNWLIMPRHWIIFAAVAVGGILLLGIWLVDSLELVLLFSSWIFLALVLLLPTYWPWHTLLPLALAVSAAGRRTILLAMFLTVGAALSYYFWLFPSVWMGQALMTIGLPLLIWGWTLFFTSTWQISHEENEEQLKPARGLSRPSWPSRPPWSRPT